MFGERVTARAAIAACVAVVVACAVAPRAAPNASRRAFVPCTRSWTNAAGGAWSVPSNWTPAGVPTSTDQVCILLSGTYTVTLVGQATVDLVTIGGSSGSQTLQVLGQCGQNAALRTAHGLKTTALGAVALTSTGSCPSNVTLAGPITNGGALTTDAGSGGGRFLQGNLTNSRVLSINQSATFGSSGTTLTNQGQILLPSGSSLFVRSGASATNAKTGQIVAGVSASLVETGGTFTEAGTTQGGAPVIVDDAKLAYTGTGSSTVALRGTSQLAGSIAAGQTLRIETSCAEDAKATAASGFTNAGAIVLTDGENCSGKVAGLTLGMPSCFPQSPS